MRIQILRGAKLEESVLGASSPRARSIVRVLEEGLRSTAVGVRADAGAVFVGERPDALRAIASFGPEAKHVLDIGVPADPRTIARAFERKSPFVLLEPSREPHFRPTSKRRAAAAMFCPLRDGTKTLGLVQLVKTSGTFDAHDRRVASALAEQTTTAFVQTMSLRRQELLAAHDPLTGLRNVRELDSELARAVGQARRADRNMALMFVDVDHLKRVNSKLGHAAGSEALRRTGKALDEAVAGVGSVFRFGGDEFVVVQRRASEESARALADHLRSHVAANTAGPMRPHGVLPKITVSVGVATLNRLRHLNGHPPAEIRARLMTTADRALFRAKSAGRNRVVLATSRDDRL